MASPASSRGSLSDSRVCLPEGAPPFDNIIRHLCGTGVLLDFIFSNQLAKAEFIEKTRGKFPQPVIRASASKNIE